MWPHVWACKSLTATAVRAGCLCALAILAAGAGAAVADAGPAAGPAGSGATLEAVLNGPLAGREEIVFAQRVSGRDHWYGNFGQYCEKDLPYSNAALSKEGEMRYAFGHGGRLCRLNLRTGERVWLLAVHSGKRL